MREAYIVLNLKNKKMATLADVQKSQQGATENAEKQKADNEMAEIAKSGSPIAENAGEYVIYKLVNTKRKGRVNIDGIDNDIMNPKTKKRERIWLLAGASSIWASDLVEVLKDKDYVNNNRRSLTFESKVLRIPKWDERAIEFAEACRHNIGNPTRRTGSKFEFFRYDPAAQQKAALEREMFEIEMLLEAQKQPEADMRKHASFLGIVFNDELGEPKTPDGIRREYILAAKRDPKRFKDSLNSKEVNISYLIKKAIIDNKIDLGGVNGNIAWAKGGFICKLPPSRKPQEFLLELAMSHTKEGQDFLEQLQTMIK